jgi:DNA-binding LacI/PurR family transcriptional regulator
MARKPRSTAKTERSERPARLRDAAYSVTSYDVARHAGVSQSAVSRAFSDGSVAPETRERVFKAARALGYQPNAIARGLITSRSNLIGLIMPASTNLYYPEVITEITANVTRRGAQLVFLPIEFAGDIDPVLDQVWRYRLDGVIAATGLTLSQLEAFEKRGTSLVYYNRIPAQRGVCAVAVDHGEGERLLVDRLWEGGHRTFGLISGPKDSEVAIERARAALDRLAQLGAAQVTEFEGDYRYESGISAFHEVMTKSPRPDALICANDAMAIGAIDAARRNFGLRVPEDISIVGFDGFGAGAWLSYALTTIRQPVEEMAKACVEMLFDRIDDPGRAPERRLFAGEMIEGGSARLKRPAS